jgi:hypothetical protein
MSKSDRLQRVHYFTGQVLGEDDFNTEQNYFIEKHRFITGTFTDGES